LERQKITAVGEPFVSLRIGHFKLSVDQYEQMIGTGILSENDRVELIRGEILDKLPIGDAHVKVVNRLNRVFTKLLEESITVSIQNPLVLADSEPEPDVAIYTRRSKGKARPADVHLVVEVADTSLEFDRTVKLPLYAEAGIRELWIVNLPDQHVEIYREPQLDGTYATNLIVGRGGVLTPQAFPALQLPVAYILPA
jgi:Uma2 family endonuclease